MTEYRIGGLKGLTQDQFERITFERDPRRVPYIDWDQRKADEEMGGAHPDINFYFVDPLADEYILDKIERKALDDLERVKLLRAQTRQETECSSSSEPSPSST